MTALLRCHVTYSSVSAQPTLEHRGGWERRPSLQTKSGSEFALAQLFSMHVVPRLRNRPRVGWPGGCSPYGWGNQCLTCGGTSAPSSPAVQTMLSRGSCVPFPLLGQSAGWSQSGFTFVARQCQCSLFPVAPHWVIRVPSCLLSFILEEVCQRHSDVIGESDPDTSCGTDTH